MAALLLKSLSELAADNKSVPQTTEKSVSKKAAELVSKPFPDGASELAPVPDVVAQESIPNIELDSSSESSSDSSARSSSESGSEESSSEESSSSSTTDSTSESNTELTPKSAESLPSASAPVPNKESTVENAYQPIRQTLAYSLFMHRHELSRRNCNVMRLAQTKIQLTEDLIQHNLKYVSSFSNQELHYIHREIQFKRKMKEQLLKLKEVQQVLRSRKATNPTTTVSNKRSASPKQTTTFNPKRPASPKNGSPSSSSPQE